jgi:hypothetical protein
MALDKSGRRMPLRDLLTDSEKRSRDLQEHMHSSWLARATDLRDLSRPLRKKSHYPTFASLLHSIERMVEVDQEAEQLFQNLFQELEEIREHARRERLNRP